LELVGAPIGRGTIWPTKSGAGAVGVVGVVGVGSRVVGIGVGGGVVGVLIGLEVGGFFSSLGCFSIVVVS
jgi:hypothetical protein